MLQHFSCRCFGRYSVEIAEGFRFAVLDESIRPADALDRGVDAGVVAEITWVLPICESGNTFLA